ncbi:MAG: hypothetical protein ABFD83_00640 [Armatimonadota bacterium]
MSRPIRPEWQEMSPEQLISLSESTQDDFRHNRSDIYKAAADKYQEAGDQESYQKMVYEALAFDLSPHKNQGYRFGCQFGMTYENGEEIQYPDRSKHFSDECIEYYKLRSVETTNPILKARYADVVWDMRPSGNYRQALLATESYIECADVYLSNMVSGDHWGIELADALTRALSLSLQLNNTELVECALTKDLEIMDKLAAARQYRWTLDILRSIADREKLKDSVDLSRLRALAENAVEHYAANIPDSHPIQRSFLEVIADLWKLEGNDDQVLDTRSRVAASHEDEAALKSGSHLISIVVLRKHFRPMWNWATRQRK